MQCLLFDTCIWLTLATKPESRSLLEGILSNLNRSRLRILLSDVTCEEYNRHKKNIVEKYTNSLKTHLKNAKKIQDYLDISERQTFLFLLDKANNNIDLSVEHGINALGIIDSIFNHKNTIRLSSSDSILKSAAQIALKKQAPCHKDKNSVADTVIYLQFENWVKESESENGSFFHFVTENIKDFSSSKDNRDPHEDLNIFRRESVYYHIDPYKALEQLELENIPLDEFDLFQIHPMRDRYAFLPCISGEGHIFNDNQGRWSHSQFGGGLSWHLVCGKCGALLDTGEFFD